MPATDFYTCRRTSLPLWTAGRSTTICIRPLAIRRSLVPGRPFCHAAASRQARLHFRPPGPVLDATLPSFPLFRLNALLLLCAKLCLPGEAESALQACNRRGIPRPTAHQRCQAPEATVSGAVFLLSPPRRPPWRAPARPLDFKPQASSLCGGLAWNANPPTSLLPGSRHVPGISTGQ